MTELKVDVHEKAAVLLFLLMFFGYPLFSSIATVLDLANRLVVVPYRSVVLLLSLFIMAPLIYRRFQFSFYTIALIVFWLYYFLRLVVDGLLSPWMFESKSLFEYWLFALGVTLLPSLAVCFALKVINEKELSAWAVRFGVVALTFCFYSYFQFVGYDLSKVVSSRYETDALNPISFGHMCVSLAIFSAYGFCFSRGIGRFFPALVFVLSLAGIVLAGSRGPMLSFVGVLGCVVFIFNRKILLLLFCLLMFFSMQAFIFFHDLAIFDRFSNGFFNDSARSALIYEAMGNFFGNVFFGAGIAPMESYPHNLLLESFMILGVSGGALFLFIVASSVALSFVNIAFGRLRLISLLYIQYFIYVMVSGSLHEVAVFWVLTFIILMNSDRPHPPKKFVTYG